MGSNTEIDKENIIPATYEHLPENVRLVLEECKKKRDEEDLLAALASIKVDRRGKVTKIKEIDFASASTDASTEVTPTATAPPSGVTMEQIQKLLAERNVYWLIGLALRKDNRLVRNQKQPMNVHLFLLLNFMFLNHRQHLLRVNLNMGCQ